MQEKFPQKFDNVCRHPCPNTNVCMKVPMPFDNIRMVQCSLSINANPTTPRNNYHLSPDALGWSERIYENTFAIFLLQEGQFFHKRKILRWCGAMRNPSCWQGNTWRPNKRLQEGSAADQKIWNPPQARYSCVFSVGQQRGLTSHTWCKHHIFPLKSLWNKMKVWRRHPLIGGSSAQIPSWSQLDPL